MREYWIGTEYFPCNTPSRHHLKGYCKHCFMCMESCTPLPRDIDFNFPIQTGLHCILLHPAQPNGPYFGKVFTSRQMTTAKNSPVTLVRLNIATRHQRSNIMNIVGL